MKDYEVEVSLKYRIYSVDEKGMLNTPKRFGYRGDINQYDDGNTVEECLNQIKKEKDYSSYVILPVTCTCTKFQ